MANTPDLPALRRIIDHYADPEWRYGMPYFTEDDRDKRLKYTPDMAKRAADMAYLGATEAQIADRLGVQVITLQRWMNTYPEFGEALRLNLEAADERVKRALYQRAVGYEYVKQAVQIDQETGSAAIVPVEVVHVPADPKAALSWLAKRQKDEWGDAPVNNNVNVAVVNRIERHVVYPDAKPAHIEN